MSSPAADRPLGELFSELASESSLLVKQEIALVRQEMVEKASQAAGQAAVVSSGLAITHIALLSLAASAIAGLSMVLPIWLAALLVGLVFLAIGRALTVKGMAGLRAIDATPQQTIRTLEENKKWVKRELSR